MSEDRLKLDKYELQDGERNWNQIVNEKKFYAGSDFKFKINQITKFVPDTISTHVFHNNHMRPMIRFCTKYFGDREIVGCEVGVADGKHAFNMLYHLNTSQVYLVDPWENYAKYVPQDSEDFDSSELLRVYNECRERLKQFGDRAVFIRKMSHDAVGDIKEKLDFVYVDANHNYHFAKRDMELYYPLVKKEGIFGGHDFSPSTPNVARAVLELADREHLKIHGRSSDWWFIKE